MKKSSMLIFNCFFVQRKYNSCLFIIFSFLAINLHCQTEAKVQRTKQVTFRNQTFDIYSINLATDTLRFYLADSAHHKFRSINNLKKSIEKQGLQLNFATNGGMYLKDGSPQGLYIENNQVIQPVDTGSGFGNFYLKPNGIFLIKKQSAAILTTDNYCEDKNIRFATQSGPLLVINGKIHPAFINGSKNKYIRSGVGIIRADSIVFAISNQPVNFYDFALLFKEVLNCSDAIYLDGAISKMYINESGRNELDGEFGCMIAHISPKNP